MRSQAAGEPTDRKRPWHELLALVPTLEAAAATTSQPRRHRSRNDTAAATTRRQRRRLHQLVRQLRAIAEMTAAYELARVYPCFRALPV